MPSVRTLLRLGRISNLPTVWSNCLAGWWLGGGGREERLPFLFAGATFLYVGGMFLNDAFDADFDAQHRRERPIPSGAISLRAVWKWGLTWLLLGALSLIWLGRTTGVFGLALILCILLYDALHKLIAVSPLLMGTCRFLLYAVAASTGRNGVTGWSIWCGLALATYVTGLSFAARRESARGPIDYWPLVLLSAPVVLAVFLNAGPYREPALLLCALLALWCAKSLRWIFWSVDRHIGRAISGLLAGIVLVDLLAVADAPHNFSAVFIGLFLAALLFQRWIPAT